MFSLTSIANTNIALFLIISLVPRARATGLIKCSSTNLNITEMMDHILADYDPQQIPNGRAKVTLEMTVADFSSLSELTSDFEVDVMYSEIWHDPNLMFPARQRQCLKNITMRTSIIDRIWCPMTSFVDTKAEARHLSPADNAFVIIYENGSVWSNVRMRIRAPCVFNLARFPFDFQECTLGIESYHFNAQEVQLFWHPKPVTLPRDVHLPDFDVHGYSTAKETVQHAYGSWDRLYVRFRFKRRYGYYVFQACLLLQVQLFWHPKPVTLPRDVHLPDFDVHGYSTAKETVQHAYGSWDRLYVRFRFKRRYGYYVFQAYFPTSLTVASSWICFWLDNKAVSARITVSVSGLLALAYQFGNVLGHLPRVSYVKCVDIWMISCMLFVFFTLVQLAVISLLDRHSGVDNILSVLKKRRSSTAAFRDEIIQLRKILGGKSENFEKKTVEMVISRPSGLRKRGPEALICDCNQPSNAPSSSVRAKISVSPTVLNMFEEAMEKSEDLPSSKIGSNSYRDSMSESGPVFVNKKELFNRIFSSICPFVKLRKYFRWLRLYRTNSYALDQICKYAFPFAFALFNAFYWAYFADYYKWEFYKQ